MIHDLSVNNVTIVGIDAENIGTPTNEGPGGGLYAVPIKLSATPSSRWAQLFPGHWDRPQEWSSKHRPGIASVRGDTIVLDGTTVEEVRDTHNKTLALAVEATNAEAAAIADREKSEYEASARQHAEHKANVEQVAAEVKFD